MSEMSEMTERRIRVVAKINEDMEGLDGTPYDVMSRKSRFKDIPFKDFPTDVLEDYFNFLVSRRDTPKYSVEKLKKWGVLSDKYTVEPISVEDRNKYTKMQEEGYHVVPKLTDLY